MRGGGGESGGEEAEKEENLGEKLTRRTRRKRRISVLIRKSRRSGPTTPVLSSWSLCPFGHEQQQHQLIIKDAPCSSSAALVATGHFPYCVSARQLAAALWEFEQYFSLSKMHRANNNGAPPPHPPPRQRHHHVSKDNKANLDLSNFLADNSPSSPDQPASANSLTRHIAASLMQHHRSIGRNNRLLQPVSPASYGSSMEVAPYNPAVTPSSSLDFNGRVGESRYNLKTSTELLKVLNRIWSLEEQHMSNIALIKALKAELDHAHVKIKDLHRVRQADRHELDDMMKQIGEDKLVRKSKEQDRIHAAVQSVRDELEDEKRLRKRSESLHRKLTRDISELKSSFSNSLRELERERKSRKLLEDLCDEFAKGIKDYEQEVHFLKQKADKDWTGSSDRDRLILHVSESWLDERMQMQLEQGEYGVSEKSSMVDRLSLEIETFLRAKQMNNTMKKAETPLSRDRRKNSLESVPLNEVVSAPQEAGDGDSLGSDSHCFELNKPSNSDFKLQVEEAVENASDEKVKTDHSKNKFTASERVRSRTPSSFQVKFEEQMAWALSCSENNKSQIVTAEQGEAEEGKPTEINLSKNAGLGEASDDEGYGKGKKDERHGCTASHMAENHIRSQLLISDGGLVHSENNINEASCSNTGWRNHASPVRQWMARFASPAHDMSESSSKFPPRKKENTLKAKLLEARSKGHRSARTKASKNTS